MALNLQQTLSNESDVGADLEASLTDFDFYDAAQVSIEKDDNSNFSSPTQLPDSEDLHLFADVQETVSTRLNSLLSGTTNYVRLTAEAVNFKTVSSMETYLVQDRFYESYKSSGFPRFDLTSSTVVESQTLSSLFADNSSKLDDFVSFNSASDNLVASTTGMDVVSTTANSWDKIFGNINDGAGYEYLWNNLSASDQALGKFVVGGAEIDGESVSASSTTGFDASVLDSTVITPVFSSSRGRESFWQWSVENSSLGVEMSDVPKIPFSYEQGTNTEAALSFVSTAGGDGLRVETPSGSSAPSNAPLEIGFVKELDLSGKSSVEFKYDANSSSGNLSVYASANGNQLLKTNNLSGPATKDVSSYSGVVEFKFVVLYESSSAGDYVDLYGFEFT